MCCKCSLLLVGFCYIDNLAIAHYASRKEVGRFQNYSVGLEDVDKTGLKVAQSLRIDEVSPRWTFLAKHQLGRGCNQSALLFSATIEDAELPVLRTLNLFSLRFQGSVDPKYSKPSRETIQCKVQHVMYLRGGFTSDI